MIPSIGVDVLVNLADKITAPLRDVEGAIAKSSERMNKRLALSMKLAGAGAAAGVVAEGARRMVTSFTDGIRDVEIARGELATLGVRDLEVITRRAQEMQMTLVGVTSDAFVRASYDIKSGISSLTDEGVADMTAAAMWTAKATRGIPEQMTSLFATSYGIFKDQYAIMSDADFGNMFGAALSASVQQFKTDGAAMQMAIESAGAGAVNLGMQMTEQLALLGMMQQTMQAGEAGTALRAFATNAAKAHEEFADLAADSGNPIVVRILDEGGALRAMPDILADLQARYGDTLDAFEAAEIKKAFGTDEAMKLINALYGQEAAVRANAQALEAAAAQGSGFTEEMARAADIGNRLSGMDLIGQKIETVSQKIGELFLPVIARITPIVDAIIATTFAWIDANPELVTQIGMVVAGLGAFMAVAAPVLVGAASLVTAWALISAGATRLAIRLLQLANPMRIVRTAFLAMRAVMMMSGIGLVVAGIAAGGMAIYRNWASIKEVFAGLEPVFNSVVGGAKAAFSGDWQGVWASARGVVDGFAEWWRGLDFAGKGAFEDILEGIANFRDGVVASFTPAMESLRDAWAQIGPIFSNIGEAFSSFFALFSSGGDAATASGIGNIASALGSIAGMGLQVAAGALELVARALETISGALVGLLQGDMDRVMTELGEFFGWLTSGITLPAWMSDFSFGKLFSGLSDLQVVETIKAAFSFGWADIAPAWIIGFDVKSLLPGVTLTAVLGVIRSAFSFAWADILPDWDWGAIIPDLPDLKGMFSDAGESLDVRLEARTSNMMGRQWQEGLDLVNRYRQGLITLQDLQATLAAKSASEDGAFVNSFEVNRAQKMLELVQQIEGAKAGAAPQISDPETVLQAAAAASELEARFPAIDAAVNATLSAVQSALSSIVAAIQSVDMTSEGARIAQSIAAGMIAQLSAVRAAANQISTTIRNALPGNASVNVALSSVPAAPIQARAKGGSFGPGWLMTGEEGPELEYRTEGGFIAHNRALQGMVAMASRARELAQGITLGDGGFGGAQVPAMASAAAAGSAGLQRRAITHAPQYNMPLSFAPGVDMAEVRATVRAELMDAEERAMAAMRGLLHD